MMKNKKKKGFTLIEMVAVVAIIGILAAILIPKVTGYMTEAKKTKVIDQARKVVQAYESTQMKDKLAKTNGVVTETEEKTINDMLSNTTFKTFLLGDETEEDKVLPNIDINTVKIKTCRNVANNGNFTMTDDKLATN